MKVSILHRIYASGVSIVVAPFSSPEAAMVHLECMIANSLELGYTYSAEFSLTFNTTLHNLWWKGKGVIDGNDEKFWIETLEVLD